jgi:Cys-tRNA(Pro)/Cys-tRNA(Cys) deacylase
MSKTNAVRILDSNNIHYTLHTYDVDENDLSGITVAVKIGADADSVFKTLVAIGDKKDTSVFCIPVTQELNLKKAATASGNKNIELVKVKDLVSLTGYMRGGCSPIGMKKKFPVFIDETAQLFEEIYISAGVRGMQIKLSPLSLALVIEGPFFDLI